MFDPLARLRGKATSNQQLEDARAEIDSLRELLATATAQRDEFHAQLTAQPKREQQSSPTTWIPPGHFYSPLVDSSDEWVRRAMESEAQPTAPLQTFGIDEELMMMWFDRIADQYATYPFSEQSGAGEAFYHYDNPNFPLADALALQGFMVKLRPSRLVEIGSGFSSCAAIDVNERLLGGNTRLTFIDPHPELALTLIPSTSSYRECFIQQKLQAVPIDIFRDLAANDILFIDSSHVVKTGSDVLDYMFRILPVLQPGVFVHVHDIFYPFEYPRDWIEVENRSWNEAYLLRAYLSGNPSLRIQYMSDWFFKCRRSLVETRMPLCIAHRGGSLWMMKMA